jgi:predicted nucleic acid-binding protein
MRFVDTNVLVYAVSGALEEAPKTRRALELLDDSDLALSVQVLQEFYVQVTRPTRVGALDHAEAVNLVTAFSRYPVQPLTLEVMHEALAVRGRYGLSYWDSAILAAARALGCSEVLSEDFNPDQDYGGIAVRNPFTSL